MLGLLFLQPYNIGINIEAFKLADSLASPGLNYIMALLAKSFFIVLPAIVLYMYFYKKDMNTYSFIIAGIVFYVVSDIIKNIVREPRPCNVSELSWINNVGCESTFSFPSNHASVLTGLAFFLKGYKYLRIAYVVWLLLILFGRIYLGVHYFTDVIAGVVLSVVLYYVLSIYAKRINKFFNNLVGRIFPKIAIKSGGIDKK
ncbi:MAG: phosphatase PAP2 family protein [Candidatus Marsarchaeota archaeon]|jgi:undecaprenyl-diphosphatase|nr:phosphatase PAP2 family protein [Candidatus Marsarchaeota archaeon]